MTAINSNRAIRGPVTAVPVVAGKGVRLVADTENNRWVVEADETVLWEGASTVTNALKNGAGLTLSESPFNFEYIEVHWVPWAYSDPGTMKQEAVTKAFVTTARPRIGMVNEWTDEGNNAVFLFTVNGYFTDSKFYTTNIKYFMIGDWNVTSTGNGTYITKIVGINRVASN